MFSSFKDQLKKSTIRLNINRVVLNNVANSKYKSLFLFVLTIINKFQHFSFIISSFSGQFWSFKSLTTLSKKHFLLSYIFYSPLNDFEYKLNNSFITCDFFLHSNKLLCTHKIPLIH